ncbi:hypothetical protein G3A43_07580 [Paraburkholderia aspalathi]|nr:hypothetical protein [Paraburkholderia aspalathi]MBK3780115.1 hypothetical protein [Paraburkholderia aspalathi]
MSNVRNLLHAAVDHLFPLAWPALDGRRFFDDMPGIWSREDQSGATWGFAGIRFCVDDGDLAVNLEWFLRSAETLAVVSSVHVGLASWPLSEPAMQGWSNAQSVSESQAILDLTQARKAWLRTLGLRERMGYALVRVKLEGSEREAHRELLADLCGTLMGMAHALGHDRRPLNQDEIARIDSDELTGHGTRTVLDFALSADHAPEGPVLGQVLEMADREGFASYQATLDIIPDVSGQPQACAYLRIRDPEYGRRTIEMELHRCGIRMQPTALRRYMHYTLPRQVARWMPVSLEKLVSLAPVARLPTAHYPLLGGVPLKAKTGELRAFAPFDAEGNANTLLLGAHGPSRHALACEMLTTHLAAGGTACVIDHEGAFEHLATMLNADVVRIGPEGSQGLDLLRVVKGVDDIYEVCAPHWIVTLAGVADEDAYLGYAAEALQSLVQAHGGSELTLQDMHRHLLEQSDPRAQELAAGLAPYIGTGSYSALFDGPPLQTGDNALTVVDVSAWQQHPLLPHVVHAVRQLLQQQATGQYCRRKKKLFVVSQVCGLHAYGRSLERWLRIARRYYMGVLILARPEDVEPSGALAEFVDEFSNCVVLALTGPAKETLQRRLGLSDSLVWELGAAGILGQETLSMRGSIRLLLYTNWELGAFEFRPDPASRELYAWRIKD